MATILMVSPYHLSLYTDMESIVGENHTGTNISVQKDLHRFYNTPPL